MFDRATIIKKIESLNICVVEGAFPVTDVSVITGKDVSATLRYSISYDLIHACK